MTPTPLDKIGLRWRDHKSALWWLGLLYRKPKKFANFLDQLCHRSALRVGFFLLLHMLIYVVTIIVVGRLFLFEVLKAPIQEKFNDSFEIFIFHSSKIIGELLVEEALAIAIVAYLVRYLKNTPTTIYLKGIFTVGAGISIALISGIALPLVGGITGGIYVDVPLGTAVATTFVVVKGGIAGFSIRGALEIFFGMLVKTAKNPDSTEFTAQGIYFLGIFLSPLTFFMVGAQNNGFVVTSSAYIVFFLTYYRIYYQLFSLPLVFPRLRGRLYRLHPIAWDDLCDLPFWRMDRLLVAYSEYEVDEGMREIERIIRDYPMQNHSALRAKTILLAHRSAVVTDLAQLDNILTRLPVGPKTGYLNRYISQIPSLRIMVHDICQLQIRLHTVSRPILGEPMAQLLCQRIEFFLDRIAGFHEPLASEFREAALHWLELAHAQLQLAQALAGKEPSPQVFRAGDPVNREQEAFVPRYGVVGDLEKQIMLATGCPGLVLYGRRRMGKSTILGNLNGFLPDTVVSVSISMQDPQAFTSLADWMSHILQKLLAALPRPFSSTGVVADLPGFMRVLSECNTYLQDAGKRVLLAIDEYENLDRKIGEKVFPEDLLATTRESIQTHRNITWIFAGSHEITELKHAEWPSYLVSSRTIEVPMFTMAETRLLLTEPLKFSPLFKDESKRPRFEPGFWGENGIERIQHEAGGWPHLVQLIAETIVDLINDETKTQVDPELFERALNKAIVSGHNVLYQLMRGESTLPGEWEYLSAFRKRELQPLPEDEKIYASLRRRLLVAEETGEWRLRVPLMARWLRERG